jgi:hypothetical protein
VWPEATGSSGTRLSSPKSPSLRGSTE